MTDLQLIWVDPQPGVTAAVDGVVSAANAFGLMDGGGYVFS